MLRSAGSESGGGHGVRRRDVASPAPLSVHSEGRESAAVVGRANATVPTKFRGRARRDAAAFYLSQIARGVLAGELTLDGGEHSTTVATSEFVLLDIEVKQKKRANSIAIKLRWPRRPLIKIAT